MNLKLVDLLAAATEACDRFGGDLPVVLIGHDELGQFVQTEFELYVGQLDQSDGGQMVFALGLPGERAMGPLNALQ